MAQHDMNIANQGFPAFRSDLNNALSALNSMHSGTSRPTSATTGTIWLDTTNAGSNSLTIKFFDGTDDITFAEVDTSANTINFIDSTVSADLINDLSPQLGGMLDVNGNAIGNGTEELIKFSETASAVNEITVTNSATGNAPEISATGDDTNIDLKLTPKGSGNLNLDGLIFPNADGTADQVLKTDGSGNLSFVDAGGGGANTPAFGVKMTSNQSVSNLATVKVNFDNEEFDTDGAYDTSNKRFTVPSGKAGKYQFNVLLHIDSLAAENLQRSTVYLYVNGSKRTMAGTAFGTANENNKDTCTICEVVDLSVGDYVEVYGQAHVNSGGPNFNVTEEGTNSSRFSGFRLVE